MNDTAILDWIERHVVEVTAATSQTWIVWVKNGVIKTITGDDLRDAVRKANGVTAVSPGPNQCPPAAMIAPAKSR